MLGTSNVYLDIAYLGVLVMFCNYSCSREVVIQSFLESIASALQKPPSDMESTPDWVLGNARVGFVATLKMSWVHIKLT